MPRPHLTHAATADLFTAPHLASRIATFVVTLPLLLSSWGCVEVLDNLQTTVDRYDAMEADLVVQTDRDGSTTTMTVDEAIAEHEVNGMTVVLIEDGALTVRRHYGFENPDANIPTDGDTIYQAASMSKFVASIALLDAARHGVDIDPTTTVEEVANDLPDSLVARWRDAKFNRKTDHYPAEIDIRRLLSHTAGLSKHGIGTDSSIFYSTSAEAILMGQSFLNIAATKPIHTPGTVYDYSGGGYTVAEAMLEAISGRSSTAVLNDHLFRLGLTRSTWTDASPSTPHLARGCSRGCSYDVRHTEVKFAGGLLAQPVEYARLLTFLLRDGQDENGRERIHPDDIRSLLTPAWRDGSTLGACSGDAECPALEFPIFPSLSFEQRCLVDRCRIPIDRVPGNGADQWYGLGVRLGSAMTDGLPRKLEHGGAQDGFSTLFKLDRHTRGGIVVMINGTRDWKKSGVTYGGAPLLDDVIDAYERHYG